MNELQPDVTYADYIANARAQMEHDRAAFMGEQSRIEVEYARYTREFRAYVDRGSLLPAVLETLGLEITAP